MNKKLLLFLSIFVFSLLFFTIYNFSIKTIFTNQTNITKVTSTLLPIMPNSITNSVSPASLTNDTLIPQSNSIKPAYGIIAKSSNIVSDKDKEKILNELSKEIDRMFNDVNDSSNQQNDIED